jgi:hypothetical protein
MYTYILDRQCNFYIRFLKIYGCNTNWNIMPYYEWSQSDNVTMRADGSKFGAA